MSWSHTSDALAVGVALAAFLATAVSQGEPVAIIGAQAHTMTRAGVLDNATIVIRDGRIATVQSGVQPPTGARIVDAGGRIVTPGLMSAGTQLGVVEVNAGAADEAVNAGPFGAAFDIQYALNPNSLAYAVARADGLTRAVVRPGGSAEAPFSGVGALLRLSPSPDIVERARAGLFVSVGGLSAASAGGSRSAQWMVIRTALDEASRCKNRPRGCRSGDSGDRLMSRLNLETVREVLDRKMPLAIAVARESDIRQAIRLADDFGIAIVIYGGAEAWRVAPLLAQRAIPVVVDAFANAPETFDEIGARADNAALLQRAGVIIAFAFQGTHATHNAGTMVREAAGIAVANGLPWEEGLKALTLNPASIWSSADRHGSLAAGLDADLVIWDGDPLESSSSPIAVFVHGEQVSLDTRQTQLGRRYSPQRARSPWPLAYDAAARESKPNAEEQ